MKKIFFYTALLSFSAFVMADCEYIDNGGKSSKLDPSNIPSGASVEASSVNALPSDVKAKLYDGSMTKCVSCSKNYIKCSK
jgi:hypothetical protein